jgi:hypothetical protein
MGAITSSPPIPTPSSFGVATPSHVAIALVTTLISSLGSTASIAYHTSQLMGIALLDPNLRKLFLFLWFLL